MAAKAFLNVPAVQNILNGDSLESVKALHVFLYGNSARDNLAKRNIREFKGFKFEKGDAKYEKRAKCVRNCVCEKEIENIRECFEVECETESDVVQKVLDRLIDLIPPNMKSQKGTQQRDNSSNCSTRSRKSNSSIQADIEFDLAKKQLAIQERLVTLQEEIFSQEEVIIVLQAKVKKLEKQDTMSAAGELADNLQELETAEKLLALKRARVEGQKQLLEKQKEVAQREANARIESIDEESEDPEEKSVFQSENNNSGVRRWLQNQEIHEENRSQGLQSEALSLPSLNLGNRNTNGRSMSISDNHDDKRLENLTENINKMLSRQTVGNNLGKFDGSSSLRWTIFLAQFKRTSEACGFSKSEEVLRLNECLTGEARSKVEMLLMTATEPSDIIRILNISYGKSEVIADEIAARAQKIPKVESLHDFESFSCEVRNVTKALENLDSDTINKRRLLATLVSKLPSHLTTQWGSYLVENRLEANQVTLNDFTIWSENMSSMLSKITFLKEKTSEKNEFKEKDNKKEGKSGKGASAPDNRICNICEGGPHSLDKCPNFLKAEVKQKWKLSEKAGVCYCCLNKHLGKCKKRNQCGINNCLRFHHQLLHKTFENKTNELTNSIEVKTSGGILKMLSVRLRGPLEEVETIAFLDDGSTASLIDASLAEKLGLSGPVTPSCCKWTGSTYRFDPDSENVSLSIAGLTSSEFIKMENVRTVHNLDITKQNWDVNKLKEKFPYIGQVNLGTLGHGQPMILIGQAHGGLIISREIIQPHKDAPILSRTSLGWIVHGPTGLNRDLQQDNEIVFACCELSENLHEEVKKYFSVENFGAAIIKEKKSKNLDEEKALQLVEASVKKIGPRYEVNLPWKNEDALPTGSREMAVQRLKCLEKKLLKSTQLGESYKEEIEKLIQKEYAVEVDPTELLGKKRVWFLPHFGVVNQNKPGKVRPVFDSAAKVNGTSINDRILIGPDWLTSLFGIILKFREYPIAFSADIREMFNRVKIAEEDTYAQCFLWRDLDLKKPIKMYRMTAMIFGMASSPFLAQFVKNLNAKKYQESCPEAVKAIISNHYVDDYIHGAHSEEEAIKLIKDVIRIHDQAGFELRNFASNNHEILKAIPRNLVSDEAFTNMDGKSAEQRVLGVTWDTSKDNLTFSTNFIKFDKALADMTQVPTKREVLKMVMSAYDPIGFLSPVTIKGRMLLQEIWRAGIGWDDFITAQMFEKWKQWLIELKGTNTIQLPRYYSSKLLSAQTIELHTMCDASEKAYGAVVYLRIQDENGVETCLVASKARVAPLRSLTVPKLELMAAVLAARLATTVADSLDLQIQNQFFWSDSRTIINWLGSEKKLQTFVAARVGEILEYSDINDWKWVSTKENVADDCTRDIPIENFNEKHRWFAGPPFLKLEKSEWPQIPARDQTMNSDDIEITMAAFVIPDESDALPRIKSYYTLTKLLRITAWMKRFIDNAREGRGSPNWKSGPLVVEELEWSEKKWWKSVQKTHFTEEREDAKCKRVIKIGRLKRVDLEIDQDGLLRISGRLSKIDNIDALTRSPVCLHGDHKYVRLMIEHLHRQNGHQGLETIINELHKKFWIPKIRAVVKKVKSECIFCRKRTSKPVQPKMGPLPENRVRFQEKPFTAVGMDYFGPFLVKVGRRLEKRYGVLFTCLTMRAVHLEVAHTLNTDSCIMSIRRFLNRRGAMKTILSDNGTNLRGANQELLAALEELDDQRMADELSSLRIAWKFNPPAAPHMGGSWERMVGSVKNAIYAVLKERHPTDEILRTVFTEAEYIVNSRPLTTVSSDSNDPASISPNDILLCHSVKIGTPGLFTQHDETIRKQWRVAQYYSDLFWQRWIKEYLPTLNFQNKWFKDEPNLKLNDIVIMQDSNLPRASWPLGIIQQIYKGKDGKVRVADVRTARGVFKRPVVKLYQLELCTDNKESAPRGSDVTGKSFTPKFG